MATREWPVPPADTTIRFIGDAHIGLNPAHRYEQFVADATREGPLSPEVACTVQIGDLTEEGLEGEDAIAIPWWTQFADPKLLVIGNHDIQGGRTTAQWATAYAAFGAAVNGYLDLPFCRLIYTYYANIDATRQSEMQAQIDGTALPCIILVHYPLRDTVLAGTAPHDGFHSATPYTMALASGSDTNIKALAADPKVKGYVHGHVHSWCDAPGFATTITAGGRTVFSLNLSAITYVGLTLNAFSDPLIGYYLTMVDEQTWEVRYRDHGAGVWTAPDPAGGKGRVTTLEVD